MMSFFSSRRRHTISLCDWSSDVCSSDLWPIKTPDKYVVSIGQGGLGLNRDYYLTPRLAEKKAAYLAYMRSEERRVGKECISGRAPDHYTGKRQEITRQSGRRDRQGSRRC